MSENSSILARYPQYEVVIGIETHVQLSTASKIFCSCPNNPDQPANTAVCPICLGHPGVLPVFNAEVARRAVMAGLATECTVRPLSTFSRKHYFYPDLPKNYQITQHEDPICSNGQVMIQRADGSTKPIRIMRIHIEEDAGKSIHSPLSNESFVDLNRAGTPLLEIVTHPDISSSDEAKAYLKALRNIVVTLGIGTGNMEEGAFRADTNISVRKKGDPKFGIRCELKNINSFKFIGDAIEYEIERHIELLERGERVRQETRLWDTKEHKTVVMRSKEEAADYRYFTDPDLPPVIISDAYLADIKNKLPELPAARIKRLIAEGLTPYEADVLANDHEIAKYYDATRTFTQSPALVNWILRDLMGLFKELKVTVSTCNISPERLAELINLVERGVINNKTAQDILPEMAKTGATAQSIVTTQGLEQIGDVSTLDAIIKEIVDNNPQNVAQYKSGKDKLWGFFVGQAMQKTKGKGNPQLINELLKKYLS